MILRRTYDTNENGMKMGHIPSRSGQHTSIWSDNNRMSLIKYEKRRME